MTAEIAIMNRQAIALAADSAVTRQQEKGQKIFVSANKIFTLSKYCPVGIMVFGSASFMGVPWETVVKVYRNELGEQELANLTDYSQHFIAFLSNNRWLFPESEQDKYATRTIYSYFSFMRDSIKQKVEKLMCEKRSVTRTEVRAVTRDTIKAHGNLWANFDSLASLPENWDNSLKSRYSVTAEKAIKDVFENLPISKLLLAELLNIALSLLSKCPAEFDAPGFSGVVIAGFGRQDVFPCLQSFKMEGIVNNQLKYRQAGDYAISRDNGAALIPFAQSEMVSTFMEGVDPDYQAAIEGDLRQLLEEYPDLIVDSIVGLSDGQGRSLKRRLRRGSNERLESYVSKLKRHRRERYWGPVVSVVEMLPKDELAAMAESLVNLTSFKRRISLDAETVGGPIDVAVISKGDGFIWIKRKHYFSAELNPQFAATYYRSSSNGQED